MTWPGKFVKFVASVLSEPTGQPSFARSASGAIVATCCFCVIFVTVKTRTIPDLAGVAGLIVAVGGVFYGTNKVAFAWGSNRLDSNGQSDSQQPTTNLRS